MAEPKAEYDQQISQVASKYTEQSFPSPHNGAIDPARTVDVAAENIVKTAKPRQSVPNGISNDKMSVGPLPNGLPAQDHLPPEIVHVTQDFRPLSKLFTRMSQECFNNLSDLVTTLSEEQDIPQANGIMAPSEAKVGMDASVRRRVRWLQWAHTERRRFIKLLVMLQWSRRAQDVRRLIDVNLWIRVQQTAIDTAWEQFGLVKRAVSNSIAPEPDIAAALQILCGGQQNRLSSFGHLLEVPLPAVKILDTVRNLNALLHIRLHLHEGLPPYLQNYTIHDGKVTFIVHHEFEVDLIIADDDPSSQFWFVDFRLLFSSIREVPAGKFEASIEQRVNSALLTHGLVGCFEVLHELCLTAKISTLRQQALALSGATWAGSLKVEQLNRSIVVQYWSNRPGKRSWIQIGVRRGKQSLHQERSSYWPSTLAMKWMMDGRETPFLSSLNLTQTDAEPLLRRVIAQHISARLAGLKQAIELFSKPLAVTSHLHLSKSDVESSGCSLRFTPRSRRNAAILIESISGKFVLQPPTSTASIFEADLNAYELQDSRASFIVEQWFASEALRKLVADAQSGGWIVEDVPGTDRDTLKRHFLSQATKLVFLRKPYWRSSDWYIALAMNSTSETAWVARLAINSDTTKIKEKHCLNDLRLTSLLSRSSDWTCEFLEKTSVAMITRLVFQRRLNRASINLTTHTSQGLYLNPDHHLAFDLYPFVQPGVLPKSAHDAMPSSTEVLLLLAGSHGQECGARRLTYVAKGRLQSSLIDSEVLETIKNNDITFNSAGNFSMVMTSDLGSTEPIDYLASRISALERLGEMVKSLRRHGLQCQSAHLNSIVFKYTDGDELAHVSFSDSGRLSLELMPASNPHTRILKQLENLSLSLLDRSSRAFDTLLRMLMFTLPLLHGLGSSKLRQPTRPQIKVYTHSLTTFVLHYAQIGARLKIECTVHRGQGCWSLKLMPKAQNAKSTNHQQSFENAFRTLCSQSGDGWSGRRTGLVAFPHAIQSVIQKTHDAAIVAVENVKVKPGPSTNQAGSLPQRTQSTQIQLHAGNTALSSERGSPHAEVVVID